MIALVTCSELPSGSGEDELAERLGASWAVWDDPSVDWAAFELVVVRSPWDYKDDRDAFVAWAQSVPRLVNPAPVLAWNTDKRYMGEVAAAGLPVVETTFLALGEGLPDELPEELVLKPTVSAGAQDTGRFRPAADLDAARALLAHIHASGRTAMLQPFLASVDVRGERALLYAGGAFSHAVSKGPILAPGEVASMAIDEDPEMAAAGPTQEERALADRAVTWLTERFGPLAYARIDLLAGEDGSPVVLELELTEPSLFLGHSPGATERFASAFQALAR
ncbi:MAG: hypothetical protein H0V81_01745 [Solirubrobacterales bacterium]|nr:hypothetical protein [Solirubrobacterales bacterium]